MLQRWDPFRELRRMDENMNRIRRGGFNGFGEIGHWAVPLDVVQDGDNVVVKATLSGINPDDIDVTIEDGILTIVGETKEEHEEKRENYLLRERRTGKFRRTLRLPDTVDADKTETTYENGVLTVTFPKVEAKKAKKLEIKAA